MSELSLSCQCGTVKGSVSHASPKIGNHLKCYCEDCQAFANHIAPNGDVLDECGGTEVFQTAPWHLKITQGMEQVQCLRLTPKGLNRWYASCCNSPIGNTINAKLPFLGIVHSFIEKDGQYDRLVGPIIGHYKLEQAKGDVPADVAEKGMPFTATCQVFWRLLKWKMTMKNKNNLFFNAQGRTICKPTIVSQ
jgi:hypothetical protein